MQPKRISESSIITSYMMLPQDANPAGNVHGGVVLKYIDTCGGIVAMRHVRGNAVTASIDRMDFLRPVHVGELVTFYASLNMVGNCSMEVGVRVEAEHLFTGKTRHCGSAYLSYVALDVDGKPTPVAPLILETEDEKRRNREALARRSLRKKEREAEQGGAKHYEGA